jgi:hypothetical protein
MTADHPRYAVAVHEAGHAVIGRVLGLACGEATIEPSTDSENLGYAVISNPLQHWERGEGPRRPLAEAFCISLYAGAEAERLIVGSNPVGDGTDCERGTAAMNAVGVRGASYVADDAYDRYEARLRGRATGLVRQYRRAIERVADALLSGPLTNEKLTQLISDFI